MLSFIIPAYNEEENISNTIEMIQKHTPSQFNYEIILVDHGSTDKTTELANKKGARVFTVHDGTIADLRNHGTKNASGNIYIFIDADVHLTHEWEKNIGATIALLSNGERLLTGSWYCIPDKPNWIEHFWFKPLQKVENTHINSGHMIISRDLFNEIGGFDNMLETGEDYDISMRAKEHGIQVVDNHSLKVIHEGYPKGLKEFMLREYWHGKGDATSLKAIVKSKVALLALLLIILHGLLLYSIYVPLNINVTYGYVFFIAAICIGASYVKFKRESFVVISINSILYYFYFLSRAGSLLAGLFSGQIKKRQR